MSKERELFELWTENLKNDEKYRVELNGIKDDEAEIKDRFYCELDFGTAGLRGVLGLGANRMNVFTVGRATQGLSDFLKSEKENPVVAIAYDSRINSSLFARQAASVFAANGIKTYLYDELMPTPALSFAVRELGCDSGVVITASHNPAKYNGYKAYGGDGCQIGPKTAKSVMENILKTDIFSGVKSMDFESGLKSGIIEMIPDSFVQKYIDRVMKEAIDPDVCKDAGLKLVYTPLNGAGNKCVRAVLQKLGVTDITVVPEQEHPDGNFPTCPYPNPEMPEALDLGFKLTEKTGADLLLATDPDADRVAAAVNDSGDFKILSGNDIGVLLLDYICAARIQKGIMPKNPVAVKSLVSTKLADAVAKEYGVEMKNVLTGFKFIGEEILKLEEKGEENRFIFGFEESCGYLSAGYVRDKDAVNGSMLIIEMACAYKKQGKTLAQRLNEIYEKHGIYYNKVESFAFEGADGMEKMAGIMRFLRGNGPLQIGGAAVVETTDYLSSDTGLPPSDVLEYGLNNTCAVIVRPSGTEPKIKIYYSLVGKTRDEVNNLARLYSRELKAFIDKI